MHHRMLLLAQRSTHPIPNPPFQFSLRPVPERHIRRPELASLARSRQRFLLTQGSGAWHDYLDLTFTVQI